MSNEWDLAELDADAKSWRKIKPVLAAWVGEVALYSRDTLQDGTPALGKFETEDLWRKANELTQVFPRLSKSTGSREQRKDAIKAEHYPPKIEAGKRLFTKDGRKVGNGIVVGELDHNLEGLGEVWVVETDFGNVLRLTVTELSEFYHLSWAVPEGPYPHSLDEWRESRLKNVGVDRVLLEETSRVGDVEVRERIYDSTQQPQQPPPDQTTMKNG